ncbi:NAD(P)/FAD-dependent oxidoreductase [Paraburkholderia sp. LEh10]|uniref:flavin-containing monooxygenase n=1 Tax=Paraburkholderia sp. LEh10 TaxID=2821353 RepID=UPI001AE73B8D|nr:NAD(P)/FAD-dependent oxidoreductase [Paraburkholderia sp. LEh10]MBP0589866.1 NAD(P)/FAD-dependent oxidoreductase [Paraburkholderia sp. LEh10]
MPSPRRAAMRIAIIGSGFSGIGMAIRLKRLGYTSFTIYEAASDLGGTWRDNTYPGAACDVPSHLYSFSFEANPSWSRAFSHQHEILAYLKHCARKYGIDSAIRFDARVMAARFDEARLVWLLDISCNGVHESVEADFVIAANGPLSRPAMPKIDGLDAFGGKIFHSARWDHEYALDGKRVAVIGTGASAIQFVPRIQPRVARLMLFQRTAPWVLPKPDKLIGERARWFFKHLPFTQRCVRGAIYWQMESRGIAFFVNPKLTEPAMKFARSYLERRVKDPALRAKLTPDYRLGCKRVLLSSDYLPALNQPNVDVVTSPIQTVVRDGIVTANGVHHAVDAIICGTGFQVNDVGAPFDVTGIGGAELGALWLRDGPQAYLGTSIADFPNFFMMVGPNTALGHNSMIYMIESQVQYIADCLRELQRRGARTMNLRSDVQRAFNDDLQRQMQRSVWASGCHSWYQTRSGKVTAIWPGFTFSFRRRTRRVRAAEYIFSR